MPDRAPARTHRDLPAAPQHRADIPAGAPLLVGRLRWHRGARGRPMVTLTAFCRRCGATHEHPWRWDWGLDPDAVSFQAARCSGGTAPPYWLALDPSAAAQNARVHAEARQAFMRWEAAQPRRRPRPPGRPPQLVPLWMPPVGPAAGGRQSRQSFQS